MGAAKSSESLVQADRPIFKLVIIVVSISTLMFVGAVSWISVSYVSPPDHIKTLIDNLFSLGKFGFGAIVGLIGCKITEVCTEMR